MNDDSPKGRFEIRPAEDGQFYTVLVCADNGEPSFARLFKFLDGSAWAAMATTLVTGFYAVTGWATNRQEVTKEQTLASSE